MAEIHVNQDKFKALSKAQIAEAAAMCPFGAIDGQTLEVGAGCKMCKLCVKNGPAGLFEYAEAETGRPTVNKSEWNGIAVYIENQEGQIHPVSLELIGKARELAEKVGFPVYSLLMGYRVREHAEELLHYGVDEVFIYDFVELETFLIEPAVSVFEDFIVNIKPSSVLVGATAIGRSLAPRVAARMRTGLTADCTKLDIKANTDLVQIRPAFGGNIMAQICTPDHRPQLATVRYKIFNAPERSAAAAGRLSFRDIPADRLKSRIKVVEISRKAKSQTISDAEIIVAVGRGVKSEKDMSMAYELAEALGAQLASTRPLAEAGWISAGRQIGLSGRTVKPKLIITLGISGSVQFKAGMENSELIIAINTDENAGIFDVCHYAVKGDIYDIVPKLTAKLKAIQSGGPPCINQ